MSKRFASKAPQVSNAVCFIVTFSSYTFLSSIANGFSSRLRSFGQFDFFFFRPKQSDTLI